MGSRERDARFDILKGLAILAVVAHHVTGFAIGAKWHGPEGQLTLEYLNRIVRFAVPSFILLSVYLVGRGIAAKSEFDWRSYLTKRLKGTISPYLVWTLLYLGLGAFAGRHSSPIAAMGFKSTAPLAVAKSLGWIFAFGKASFHLYFLVALFQIQLLLPWVVRQGKKWFGEQFWKWVVAGVISQIAIYVISHEIGLYFWSRGSEPPLPPFSSMFYGYALPLLVGAGLAVCVKRNPESSEEPFPSGWLAWLLPVLIYVPYAINDVTTRVSIAQEGLFMAYSTTAGVALLSLCGLLKGRTAGFLALAGTDSLGIYLVHPIILQVLRPHTGFLGRLPVVEVWAFLFVLGITWSGLWLMRLCRIDRILFGR